MINNLAEVAAQLEAGVVEPLIAARDGALARDAAAAMVARGRELMAQTFATSTAPSGAPWAPPARDYGHPLLRKTGALEGSGNVEIGPRNDASGFDITFSYTDEKAPWQHFGTKRGGRQTSGLRRKSGASGAPARQHIPPRHLLPAEGEDDLWREDLEVAGQEACDRWITANVKI